MKLNPILWIVLDRVRARGADLREIGEQTRQAVITLAMQEPPLVDVDADQVSITDAGIAALKAQPNY